MDRDNVGPLTDPSPVTIAIPKQVAYLLQTPITDMVATIEAAVEFGEYEHGDIPEVTFDTITFRQPLEHASTQAFLHRVSELQKQLDTATLAGFIEAMERVEAALKRADIDAAEALLRAEPPR